MAQPQPVPLLRLDQSLLFQSLAVFAAAFGLGYLITFPAAGAMTFLAPTMVAESLQKPSSFFLAFAIASVVAFLLIKYLPGEKFWQLFFAAASFAGIFVTFTYLGLFLLPATTALWIAGLGALSLLLFRNRRPWIWLHNLVVLLSAVGVARLFGFQFSPDATRLIIIVLAVYDIIAVYFSGHMVTMARRLFERQAFFGVILPQQLSHWREPLTAVEPGKDSAILGAGDLAFPLFYALSFLFYEGTAQFWVITAFTGLGVLLLHLLYTLPKKARPMPALPPLVACQLLGTWLLYWFV